MIALAMCGRFDDCETFDRTVTIVQRVNTMSTVRPHLVSIYEELLRGISDPQLSAAVQRLIADSRGRPTWLYQRMRRWRRKAGASRLEAVMEQAVLSVSGARPLSQDSPALAPGTMR